MIRPVDWNLELSDLRSSNGTRVNGQPVDGSHVLKDGDEIKLGQTKLKIKVPSRGTATHTRKEVSLRSGRRRSRSPPWAASAPFPLSP